MSQPASRPLGQKCYDKIDHLPGSRLGPGDRRIDDQHADQFVRVRKDPRSRVIVEEKLDGSNVAVAKVDGAIVPLTRAGYLAAESRREQHRLFANWVFERQDLFDALLANSERLVGEWLAQAHGTRYALPHEPFVALDLMVDRVRRGRDEFWERLDGLVPVPRVLSDGPPFAIVDALELLEDRSHHGAIDPVEGAVWRMEKPRKPTSLCKYVRHDKVDGLYFDGEPVWNWRPGDTP